MRLWCCAQFCVHWKLWTCPLDVCVLCYGGEFHLRVWFTNSFLFFLWRSRPSDPSSPSLWGLVFKRLPCTRPRFLHDEEGCLVFKDGKDFLIFLPCICWTLIPFWRNGVLSVLYQKHRWTPLSLPTVLEFIKQQLVSFNGLQNSHLSYNPICLADRAEVNADSFIPVLVTNNSYGTQWMSV